MSTSISQDNNGIDQGRSGSEEHMAELQKAMASFLLDVRRLHAEHERKIRGILRDIDQRKAEAISDSIKKNYGTS